MRLPITRPGLLVCSGRTFGDVPAVRARGRRAGRRVLPCRSLDRLAGARVQRRQHAGVQVEQPAVVAVVALPVVDAARRDGAFVRTRPQLAARRRVERDDLVVACEHVHDVVDDDGIEDEAALADGEAPRDLELRDVRLVDLVERRVLRRVAAAAVGAPGGVRPLFLPAALRLRAGGGQSCDETENGGSTLLTAHAVPPERSFLPAASLLQPAVRHDARRSRPECQEVD